VAMVRTLGLSRDATVLQRLPGAAGRIEPSYPAYPFGQAAVDLRTVVGEVRQAHVGARDWYVGALADMLDVDNPWFVPIRVFAYLVAVVAYVAAVVAAGLLQVVVIGVHTLVISVTAAVALGLAGLLRAWELAIYRFRRLRVRACRVCGEHVPVPMYRCPGEKCGREHHDLIPGRRGLLHHVCWCGRRLPTMLEFGRRKLAAYCPSCHRRMPRGSDRTAAVHLPFVGAQGAGTTSLLLAVLAELTELAKAGTIGFEPVDEQDRDRLERLASGALDSRLNLPPLGHDEPDNISLLVFVTYQHRRRLLYLYDAGSHRLRDREEMAAPLFLQHAAGLVLTVDAFAFPGVRATIAGRDERAAKLAAVSQDDAEIAYSRLAGSLLDFHRAAMSRLRAAVVVTKADALELLTAVPPIGPGALDSEIRSWLEQVDGTTFVRQVEADFPRGRFFAVSARRGVSLDRRPADAAALRDLASWLLEAVVRARPPTMRPTRGRA